MEREKQGKVKKVLHILLQIRQREQKDCLFVFAFMCVCVCEGSAQGEVPAQGSKLTETAN